jgi:hypothetical protein
MARKRVDKNRLRKKSRNDPSNLYALAGGEAMTNARLRVGVVAFTLVLVVCSTAHAQQIETSSPKANQRVLSLSIKNSGQHLTATVGQQIEITLGTVGPPQYGKPVISSPAIRLASTALWRTIPAGPTFIYIFEAAEGEAQVTVPLINTTPNNPQSPNQHTFVVTIRVAPARRNSPGLRAALTPDQSNTAPWKNAWTNLKNARQDFVPSLPRLTAVEVELVVANSGPESDEVTLGVGNKEVGDVVSKTVTVDDCSHVLFLLPKGGLQVVPGQVYTIGLNSDHNVFGEVRGRRLPKRRSVTER